MNKADKLLAELMQVLAVERNQTADSLKNGDGFALATDEELLEIAKTTILKIAKIKRIEAVLDDVKSMLKE